jgi:hypothetical protein
MMRGRKTLVTAVRDPRGEVVSNTTRLAAIYSGRARRTPIVRGVIVLIESLVLGINSLMYAANVSLEEEGKEDEKVSNGFLRLVVLLGVALAAGLFIVVPLVLTRLLHIGSPVLFNLVDGVIRVAILVAYLAVMGLVPDLRRVFAYHGAEHKAVNAYEAGASLDNPESIRRYSTAHLRCGTSFLFAVVLISIFVFALVGIHAAWLMVLARILLIPVIAGLGYEVIYFGGRHADNRFVRVLMTPGLWLQSLTTRQPDDAQLEVALTALKKVMEADEAPEPASTPTVQQV